MITVGMDYEVLEGKEQPFEKKFALVLEAMSQMTGHSHTHLYRNVFRERSYLVVSEWDTRRAFDDFVQSDAFSKVTGWGKANILSCRPKHTVYGSEDESLVQGGCPQHAG